MGSYYWPAGERAVIASGDGRIFSFFIVVYFSTELSKMIKKLARAIGSSFSMEIFTYLKNFENFPT